MSPFPTSRAVTVPYLPLQGAALWTFSFSLGCLLACLCFPTTSLSSQRASSASDHLLRILPPACLCSCLYFHSPLPLQPLPLRSSTFPSLYPMPPSFQRPSSSASLCPSSPPPTSSRVFTWTRVVDWTSSLIDNVSGDERVAGHVNTLSLVTWESGI